MKKFTKSISSIIMLCLLLAGNSVYSKKVELPSVVAFAPTPDPVVTQPVRNGTTSISFTITNYLATTGYVIQKRTNAGTFANLPTAPNASGVVTDVFTVVPGNSYFYTIVATATVPAGSTASNTVSRQTLGTKIEPVINTVTAITSFRIGVDWNQGNPADFASWELQRNANGGAYTIVSDVSGTNKDDGLNRPYLLPNTEYCYKLRYNTNSNGTSNFGPPKCARTPALPQISNLSANAENCSRINLSWTEPSNTPLNESNYKIYRQENGGSLVLIATTGNNISSYGDNDLKPNTTYSYQVASVYGDGDNTPNSAPASAKTSESVLQLLSAGASTANIKWNLCTQFSQGWKIYLSTNGGDFVEAGTVGPQVDSYTFTNLNQQTQYAAYVINYFGNGFGGPSNSVSFATSKLPIPTNLKVEPVNTSSLKVTWEDSSSGADNEEAFILYKSLDNGVTFTAINLPPLNLTYTDNGLNLNQKVCYYVVARYGSGFSEPSNTSCNYTCPPTLTEFTKIESISSSQIALTWNKLEGGSAITVNIEGSLDGINFTKIGEVSGTEITYTDNTVLPNQKKYYRANVKNQGTCVSIYSLVSSTTSCSLAPTGVKAVATSSSTVEVTWDLGEGIKTYYIERSLDNIDFVAAGEVDGTLAKFEDTKLASSKKYYYRVSGKNEGSCISAPSIVKQESTAITCASPPSALVAVANSAKEIKLTFTDNSPDESGFEVEWSKDGTTFAKVGGNLAANVTSITISTGIDAETKYFFRIRAIGELCNSDYSNVANVTTNPPAPTGLTATGVKINQNDLAWTNTSKTANGIEIQRAAGADNNFVEINKAAVSATSYQNVGLTPATSYKYRLRYTSPNGNSDWSNVAEATTLVISANEDNAIAKQITLYPVPSDNTLFIKPSGSILGKISTKIVNASGATLISQDFNGFVDGKTEQINVSNLNTGIYFLEISTVKGSATKKFMKR
jgi:Secretion system C-terminal sorting domain/Fibronectin type III domain